MSDHRSGSRADDAPTPTGPVHPRDPRRLVRVHVGPGRSQPRHRRRWAMRRAGRLGAAQHRRDRRAAGTSMDTCRQGDADPARRRHRHGGGERGLQALTSPTLPARTSFFVSRLKNADMLVEIEAVIVVVRLSTLRSAVRNGPCRRGAARSRREVAMRVLRDGGTPVDAAIAGSAVQCVVEMPWCGFGGDAFALVRDCRRRHCTRSTAAAAPPRTSLDALAPARAGAAVRPVSIGRAGDRRRVVRAARPLRQDADDRDLLGPGASPRRRRRRRSTSGCRRARQRPDARRRRPAGPSSPDATWPTVSVPPARPRRDARRDRRRGPRVVLRGRDRRADRRSRGRARRRARRRRPGRPSRRVGRPTVGAVPRRHGLHATRPCRWASCCSSRCGCCERARPGGLPATPSTRHRRAGAD